MITTNQNKGILYMIIACLLFSCNNSVVKYLSLSISPQALVFYKNITSLIILFPFVLFMKGKVFVASNFNRYNWLRSLIDVVSTVLWFMAVRENSITQAVSVTFLTPFMISIIAILMLKERVKSYQWLLMFIGLIGCLVVVRPSGEFNFSILYAVMAAFLWSISAVLFKKLTFIQGSFIIIFFLKILKSFFSIPFLLYDFQLVTQQQIMYLVFLGILTNSAIFFVAKAYKKADISVVVPFDFMRLVFTAMLSFMIFGEEIEMNTLYGSLVILVSSSLLARKLNNSNRRRIEATTTELKAEAMGKPK